MSGSKQNSCKLRLVDNGTRFRKEVLANGLIGSVYLTVIKWYKCNSNGFN